MLLAVLVIIGKYTDLKKIMYAFFLFVCFNWPKWVLLFLQCDEVLLCTERWTGDFFNIHIYIFWGGWEDFLTLYSVAVKQCTLRWAWAAKRLFCLLWQTSTYTGFPFSNFPPGVQAELISGFHNTKHIGRTSEHNQFSWRQTWLKTNFSYLFKDFFWWWW